MYVTRIEERTVVRIILIGFKIHFQIFIKIVSVSILNPPFVYVIKHNTIVIDNRSVVFQLLGNIP